MTTSLPDPLLPLPRRTSADTEGDTSRVLGKLEQSGQIMRSTACSATRPRCSGPSCSWHRP